MSNASALVADVLHKMSIVKIVYVDDLFDVTPESLLDVLRDAGLERIQQYGQFEVAFDSPDAVVWDALKALVQALNIVEIRRHYSKFGEHVDRQGAQGRDHEAVHGFLNLIPPSVQCSTLGVQAWEQEKAQLLADAGGTLFIFDEHLGGTGKLGRNLAAEVLGMNDGLERPCALLTHSVSDAEGEDDLLRAVVAELVVAKEGLVVIAKESLAGDAMTFPGRLKSAIFGTRVARLKKHVETAISESVQKANDVIGDLSVEEFESIVFHSSRVEGAWPPDTLLRIYAAVQGREARQRVRASVELHRLVDAMSPALTVDAMVSSLATRRSRAAEIQSQEFYDGAAINDMHLPLDLGDVFRFGGKDYALVGQPCDLMVRQDGSRRGDAKLDFRLMVPLVEIDAQKVTLTDGPESDDGSSREGEFPLDHYPSPKKCVAKLARVIFVPTWLLDFCSFRVDGKCYIESGQHAPEAVPASQRLRFTKIRERVERIVIRWRAIGNAVPVDPAERNEYAKAMLTISSDVGVQASIADSNDQWSVKIELSRVRRVREPIASALLSAYGQHITRPAAPHDLGRFVARERRRA